MSDRTLSLQQFEILSVASHLKCRSTFILKLQWEKPISFVNKTKLYERGKLTVILISIVGYFFFYSYKKFTTIFTFYYTYLATIQYYRDDAKGSEGQRLPQSLNIKTRIYTLHTTNCTPHTVKGQRILYLILLGTGSSFVANSFLHLCCFTTVCSKMRTF